MHVLSQVAHAGEVPVQKRIELLKVELFDVKRIRGLLAPAVDLFVGSGYKAQPAGLQQPLDLLQEFIVVFDVFNGFETHDDVKRMILREGNSCY